MLNKEEANDTELMGLASYLVRDGLVTLNIAKEAIKAAQQQETTLTHYLIKSERLTSQTIFECCVKNLGLPVFDLKNYDVTLLGNSIIKPAFIWRYRVLPISRDVDTLYLGMADPTDHAAITAISFHTGLYIHPLIVAEKELDDLINTHCRSNMLFTHLETALSKLPTQKEQPLIDAHAKQAEEPVIQFVDRLLQDAITKKISDIHLEPYSASCRIRFRRDGLLYEAAIIPSAFAIQIATRLKVMALLNIAERRLPQDGRLKVHHENIDIRINTCPTLFGEKIVLRILNKDCIHLRIDSLGMTPAQKNLFLATLSEPQGLILVTGPTGSGKTVTLYSALHYLNRIEKNIMTIEDPVEIELDGINQVNINLPIGFSFAKALHTFLRQDPDIIMVGEIRDKETAEIAIQAAHTGHLVLSTLHTHNAVETITRLKAMGALTPHLSSAISLIIAQRLVRTLCQHCKAYRSTRQSDHQAGCERCQGGYNGRVGIFELLPMSATMLRLISSGVDTQAILDQTRREGHMILSEAGLEKIAAGLTTQTELTRIIGK